MPRRSPGRSPLPSRSPPPRTCSPWGPISASTEPARPRVAALVLAALAEPPDAALDAALGSERAAALRAALAARAGTWAAGAADSGLAFASSLVPAATVDGTRRFEEPGPDRLAAALADALAGHDGPVLLAAPDAPGLAPDLAAAALSDLAAGCRLSFAPATDGRPFLLALARPDPDLLALLATRDRRRDEIATAAVAAGGEIGLLRSERRLVTPADARALVVDPLAPPNLRRLAGA